MNKFEHNQHIVNSFINGCCVCLSPGNSVNHLDHLVVISYILHIPVVTDEESVYQALCKYYPQVYPIYIQEQFSLLEFLAQNYEILFISCAHYRHKLSPLFEKFFHKQIYFCYCPHGNSDKPVEHFQLQNLSLIYGDQMEDRLNKMGMLSQLDAYVRTSNYRFPFYWIYADFYDQIVEDQVFSKFHAKQLTILYAPTWQDMTSSSSLFDAGSLIIEQLPDHYNLIVKFHPWLLHYHAGHVAFFQEKYRDKPNILFLDLFPLVLPLLNRTDIYLGDASSVGYDFLRFNRPMFFFEPSIERLPSEERLALHSCGMMIPKNKYRYIYSYIEDNLNLQNQYKEIRNQLYHYSFGNECSLHKLREKIINVIGKHVSMRIGSTED